jgi:hypothetical protein
VLTATCPPGAADCTAAAPATYVSSAASLASQSKQKTSWDPTNQPTTNCRTLTYYRPLPKIKLQTIDVVETCQSGALKQCGAVTDVNCVVSKCAAVKAIADGDVGDAPLAPKAKAPVAAAAAPAEAPEEATAAPAEAPVEAPVEAPELAPAAAVVPLPILAPVLAPLLAPRPAPMPAPAPAPMPKAAPMPAPAPASGAARAVAGAAALLAAALLA